MSRAELKMREMEVKSSRKLPQNWENLNKWTWDDYIDNFKKTPQKIKEMELCGNKIFGKGFAFMNDGYDEIDFLTEKDTFKDDYLFFNDVLYNRVDPKSDILSSQNANKYLNGKNGEVGHYYTCLHRV